MTNRQEFAVAISARKETARAAFGEWLAVQISEARAAGIPEDGIAKCETALTQSFEKVVATKSYTEVMSATDAQLIQDAQTFMARVA